jgi:hypothetical protein
VDAPTWSDFAERPVREFEMGSPAGEIATVLRRYRADLDAAARAGAEGRAQGLRALAEQAVLAVELDKQLESPSAASEPAFAAIRDALRALTDRMLVQIEAAGLEIVRLRGSDARSVAELALVDSWRYDDAYETEVVVEELEAAVRHLGAPLRLGRVVMGAPPGGGPREPDEAPAAPPHPGPRGAASENAPELAPVICPVADCGAHNAADAEVCAVCLTQLGGYRRLSLFPQVLFNRGLQAALAQDSRTARDCFAAVVLWCPDDLETRNAYGLACLECGDARAAGRAWREVLARAPGDVLARRGLTALGAVAGPR